MTPFPITQDFSGRGVVEMPDGSTARFKTPTEAFYAVREAQRMAAEMIAKAFGAQVRAEGK